MEKYNPREIEAKWQKVWDENVEKWQAQDFSDKPKFYTLFEFPYPSGDGLHMGHLRGQTAVDVYARKKRLEGFNVMTPIGWDAFGLPTENYAIKHKIQPAVATRDNIAKITKQEKMLGYFLDWNREINTSDPSYYKWTQWIFLQLFKHGLAYKADMPINWCPSCKIGLANEEVIDGKCERCGTPVVKRNVSQWLLRITMYADKLLDGLKDIDFPERVKTQQINWIGRSEGTIIKFKVQSSNVKNLEDQELKVFTTRADTLFGVTFMVVSPEHALISNYELGITNYDEVAEYVKKAKSKSDLERTDLAKEKTGVELKGIKAINPINNKEIPVFVADYVLSNYGTGAIMAVPAHDERDWEFAKKYNLPIIQVIQNKVNDGDNDKLFTGCGVLINSGEFNGQVSKVASNNITNKLKLLEAGETAVNYKLRDWIFSRQHYWGEPIPLVFCENCAEITKKQETRNKHNNLSQGEIDNPGWILIPDNQLPVTLPDIESYEPTDTGESPLAKMTGWVNTTCPKCGGPAKRETDTMPNWAGSSWYFLAYALNQNSDLKSQNIGNIFKEKQKELAYWMSIDMYEGGMEHTTLHLLYSRFWNEFLFDIGVVPVSEPYKKRVPHGIILAADGKKMSKSIGNVVNPDQIVKQYGADTARTFAMFIGPFDRTIAWDEHGLVGVYRFLNKVWDNISKKTGSSSDKLDSIIQNLIVNVSNDIESFHMNTAVAKLMEFNNLLSAEKEISKEIKSVYLRLLYPFAPHLCEELSELCNLGGNIYLSNWPKADKSKIKADKISMVIQINSKNRDLMEVQPDENEKSIINNAKAQLKISTLLAGKNIAKIIVVKDKLINFVVR